MKKAVSEISSKTIFNCWQHCNILNGESSVDSNVNKVNELNLEEIQSGLNLIKKRINLVYTPNYEIPSSLTRAPTLCSDENGIAMLKFRI